MICKDIDELINVGQTGDWCFTNNDTSMWLRYPDPDQPERGGLIHLYLSTIEKPNPNTSTWNWDGNRDVPTLSPSIGVYRSPIGSGFRWHGFLRNGKLETV